MKKLFGGYEFSGRVKGWVDDFRSWYEQDFRGQKVSFEAYLLMVSVRYQQRILQLLNEQGRIADVQEFRAIEMVRDAATYDMLDFIVNLHDFFTVLFAGILLS